MTPHVRPFTRADRDQLTALVNAHVGAVVPGIALSVNAVLSQLEREPGEFIVDPWVVERRTLVAEQRGRVSAAAHLVRYGDGPEVGDTYRGTGEIRWLLCWPDAPFWPDATAAGDAVAAAAVAYLTGVGHARVHADGALPAPGVYGLPAQWPHIHAMLRRAGFRPGERTEVVLLADVAAVHKPAAPVIGLSLHRTLGSAGVRLTAVLDGAAVGYVEVDGRQAPGTRSVQHDGWADIGNLYVPDSHRRRGIASWLLGQAAEWLRLGHVDRVLDYASPDDEGHLAFLRHAGFVELTRTTRDWELHRNPSR